jgi:hypothetical protein
MMQLKLSDADRDRWGGPEWLDWDEGARLTIDEATQLQELLGVGYRSYRTWLGSAERNPSVVQWVFWLSLRRAGTVVAWDDLGGADLLAARHRDDPEPEGKDPGSTPPSPSDSDSGSTPPP